MNVFTTDAFLETVGELYFPARRRAIEVCRVEGRLLRLLVLDGHEIVRTAPFYDYPQPLDGPVGGPVRELAYFPRTVVATTTIAERTPEVAGFSPSPYIEWARFADHAAFEKHVESAKASHTGDSPRQRRRLERDLGPLAFVFDDPRPEAFDACLRWKSSQYLATGLSDMFAAPQNVELFHRLRRRGVVVVSSLSAGSTLLAVHLGGFSDRRFAWWVPAYDPARSKFSPGRLLLEDLMRASHARGDLEFDFLIGDEAYKFLYATHNRVIGPLGTPPLKERLLAEAEKRAKQVLSKYPRAYELARGLKRRLTQ